MTSFKVFPFSFLISVFLLAWTTVYVQGQLTTIRSAILLDLRRTKLTEESLSAAIDSHIERLSMAAGMKGVFDPSPVILNSNGSLLVALAEVQRLLTDNNTRLDVLFLAESADVSIGVSDVLKRNSSTSGITIISAHTSNPKLCEISSNPTTVCFVPRDLINVRAALEVVSSELQWSSVAAVFSSDAYGTGVESIMDSQIPLARSAPTVVTRLFITSSGTTEDDDNLVNEILRFRPVGILCFVSEEEFRRLRSAIIRLGKENDLILFGSREAVNMMDELQGSYQPLVKLWGTLFVSEHASIAKLITQGYFNYRNLDNYAAYIVSHLFDAMQAVALAGSASPTVIRSVNFQGFTGSVSFDTITGQRVGIIYSLLSKSYTTDQPLISWNLPKLGDVPAVMNYNPTATAALIAPSPLRAVTICMAAANSCSEVESLNAMTYVFLQNNKLTSNIKGATTFIPLSFNTGLSGVEGLVSLIPVARSCSVLIGPGRGRVAISLTPVINQFGITQVDFNTAETIFSDRLAYPYFSRSIPDNMFNYMVYGEICSYFAWERVIVVVYNDQFGNARLHSLQKSMEQRNIHVEKVYELTAINKEEMTSTMESIYKVDISRIVVVLLPLFGDDAKTWFDLFDELSFMKKYVFILSNEICQYAATNPEERNKAQSSLCVRPHISKDRVDKINSEFTESGLYNEQMRVLIKGGFAIQVSQCNLSSIRTVSAFAVDAAYTVINAVDRAVNKSVSLNKSSNLMPFIRSTSIDIFSPTFEIDKTGNRNFAAFAVDIQVPNRTIVVGTWNVKLSPPFRYTATEKVVWFSESTEVPADTFRDIQFILGTTVKASPGTIVLSVLGFVGTIAVFAFCYRHYKMQKLVELSLESNRVPVTEEELRRLRGESSLMGKV
ncbi:extracellular receptor [Trypanosoma theileri]|uniref:Extracellular receptor n=1 Tax=Trypanosoma theileri TaxID=67003 RepID=A0A1X0P7Q8_9TRYP|nr:extracellular receptor [Trypanosoma theileri]ORC92470.1 extracellular receptor [Trypanosoma theileri]